MGMGRKPNYSHDKNRYSHDIPMIFPWYSWECQGFLVTPIAIAMAGQKHGEGTLIRADGGSYTGGWAEAPNDQLGSNSENSLFRLGHFQ